MGENWGAAYREPLEDKLGKAISAFGAQLGSSKRGTLTQGWVPEPGEDGGVVLITQVRFENLTSRRRAGANPPLLPTITGPPILREWLWRPARPLPLHLLQVQVQH